MKAARRALSCRRWLLHISLYSCAQLQASQATGIISTMTDLENSCWQGSKKQAQMSQQTADFLEHKPKPIVALYSHSWALGTRGTRMGSFPQRGCSWTNRVWHKGHSVCLSSLLLHKHYTWSFLTMHLTSAGSKLDFPDLSSFQLKKKKA